MRGRIPRGPASRQGLCSGNEAARSLGDKWWLRAIVYVARCGASERRDKLSFRTNEAYRKPATNGHSSKVCIEKNSSKSKSSAVPFSTAKRPNSLSHLLALPCTVLLIIEHRPLAGASSLVFVLFLLPKVLVQVFNQATKGDEGFIEPTDTAKQPSETRKRVVACAPEARP